MSEVRDSARWLAGQLTANRNAVKALSAPQLGTSSIETGAIEEYDVDGTLASVTGEQFDGTHAAVTLAGPVPPEPVAPTVTAGINSAEVRWNGKFADDALSPMDFSHVAVHASPLESFDPDNTTQRATITGESGDTATVALESGEWYFLLVAVSKAGKWSTPSDVTMGEVQEFTPDSVTDQIIDLDTRLDEVQTGAGGNTITNATVDADIATPGAKDGDRWQKWDTLDAGGKLLATWRWDGAAWIAEAMDPAYLPLIDIGQGTFGSLNGSRLVAESVKAGSLETELVLSTDIVAGNPAGDHARMNPTGFHVMAVPADGGAPTEVVSLGTSSSDYLNITDSTGKTVASIGSTGGMTSTGMDVDAYNPATGVGGLTIGGTQVSDSLAALPKGLVAWASRATNSLYWAGTAAQPYLHLQFDAEAGRAYNVETSPITTDSDTANVEAIIYLQYDDTGAAATTSSPVIASGLSGQISVQTRRTPVTINRMITPSAGPVSLLISYGTVSTGRAKIVPSVNGRTVFLTVTDIGPFVPMTGENRDGTADATTTGAGGSTQAPAPAVKKNYDKTWSATGIRSFMGNGSQYGYNTGYMYSGLQYGTSNGDMSSMAVFPSFTATDVTAGSTITGVWVYVYYDFWYYGSGGDAYIGLHGQTGLTGTAPTKTYSHALSAGWPRAAGRWIKLNPATYDGFRTGQHRGFTLGGSGGGYERYGYAHNPKIRITWTK
ncbi:hypothetical protein [Arthrobacter sp. Soil763]|uniref:hypothetical protein n=1 Tax=Arthrobacter sp. Soil763 TaxID=1736402 RepID=UPI0006F906F3|nr:hypothetical protein [Arthrobacter sp. Soil763]KRE79940.1 hypothetical protein ASG71_07860 [Arthrobacter sp. Soil763]